MQKQNTFAYLLLACPWSPDIQAEVWKSNYSDFLEFTMEMEDQIEDPTDITYLKHLPNLRELRVAPVQLTLAWDPRPYLLSIFAAANIKPRYRQPARLRTHSPGAPPEVVLRTGPPGQRPQGIPLPPDDMFYFDRFPPGFTQWPEPDKPAVRKVDQQRFLEVLQATMGLARRREYGLLFVGGEGWSYEVDGGQPLSAPESVLRKGGMLFFDHHG